MDIALWIVAGILAFGFVGAGLLKLTRSRQDLIASGMGWAEDFSQPAVRAIGAVEILGAIGLVVPPLVDVAPSLAAWAAAGLAITMAGAAATHVRRGETKDMVPPLVLLALALFVAWGRFGPHAF